MCVQVGEQSDLRGLQLRRPGASGGESQLDAEQSFAPLAWLAVARSEPSAVCLLLSSSFLPFLSPPLSLSLGPSHSPSYPSGTSSLLPVPCSPQPGPVYCAQSQVVGRTAQLEGQNWRMVQKRLDTLTRNQQLHYTEGVGVRSQTRPSSLPCQIAARPRKGMLSD